MYSKITKSASLLLACSISLSMLAVEKLAEGKTKIIQRYEPDSSLAIFQAKNDITAGDGAKHDIIVGKAELATTTTCNVFRLLDACDIPVAFKKQLDATSFLGFYCTMIPYEVVVRREAHGSYLKRNPNLHKGDVFPQLVVEFFLKTSDRVWRGQAIPKDDPFIQFRDGKACLYLPNVPIENQKPFMILDDFPLADRPELFERMSEIACRTFLILEKAWQLVDGRLVDFKVEFGFDAQGNLLLADVIDNDSWRVIHQGNYVDKQVYRDGGNLDKVSALYRYVAESTSQFTIPEQQIILWSGSEKDDTQLFTKAFDAFSKCGCSLVRIVKSAHKQPVHCYLTVQELVQKNPNTVIIAFIGASNAAGPLLSANTCIPVINVPADWRNFHEDIWSSLRLPSNSTAMTMLNPENALLAAMQILAMRNPALYAKLRYEQEKRLINIIQL
jgi:phosphoribosylaminoimidazole carboxylase / phosphoribosylaminoimidazole-succinocarboxamide synthase